MAKDVLSPTDDCDTDAAVAHEAADLVLVPRVVVAAVCRNEPGAIKELCESAAGQPLPQVGLPASAANVVRPFPGSPRSPEHLVEANEKLVIAAVDSARRADIAVENLAVLTRISERDPLTDTPNRALMLDRIECSIVLARRQKRRAAILFVDLDGFKQINDTLGHATGDEALRVASRRLELALRDSDTVSRHGGDEFLVLLGSIKNPSDAGLIASKLIAALAQPATVGDKILHLSMSIGIAIYPDDGNDTATLIGGADAAMFRSKRRGPGGFEFWKMHSPGMAPVLDIAGGGTSAHPTSSWEYLQAAQPASKQVPSVGRSR